MSRAPQQGQMARLGSVLAVVLGLAACAERGLQEGHGELQVVLDLASRWRSARTVGGEAVIRFGDPSDRDSLVEGWGNSEPSGERGRAVVWATETVALIEKDLLDADVHEMSLTCMPFVYPGAPVQRMRLDLNGVDLGSFELEPRWSTCRVSLPAGAVRRGRNRLRLEFAHTASPACVLSGSSDRRTLAVAFDRLTFGSEDRDLPAGPPVIADGGLLRVAAGHALVYRVAVPSGGLLELGSGTGCEEAAAGTAEVWVGVEGEPVVQRLEITSRPDQSSRYVDLSDLAGSVVDLWLVAPAGSGLKDNPSRVTWVRPRLVTAEPEAEVTSSVVLVVVDTLRADFVGCYGGASRTSAMDGLAAAGVRFDPVYSHIPITGPSHASLFTSLLPMEHGVHNNAQLLAGRHKTMAEMLRDRGRSTAGFVSLGVLQHEYGFAQGFETYQDRFGLEWQRPAAEMTDLVERWIREEAEEPFFLFVHYSDPHEPYAPPTLDYPEVVVSASGVEVGRFSANGRVVSLRFEVGGGATRLRFDAAGEAPTRRLGFFDMRLRDSGHCTLAPGRGWWIPERRGPTKMSTQLPADLTINNPSTAPQMVDLRFYCKEILSAKEARAYYGLEVEYVDREIGRLLDGLGAAGLLDNTLVVLTSDHGEGVGDHRLLGHVDQLYDSLIRVPLIMSFPGRLPAGEVVQGPSSLIDVLPTVLDVLGLPRDEGHRGRSLLPLVRGARPSPRALLAETYRPEAPADLRAVVDNGHKLIVDLAEPDRAELYDLVDDPGELHDLAGDLPELVERLRASMTRVVGGADRVSPQEAGLTEDERAQLRALGYVHE